MKLRALSPVLGLSALFAPALLSQDWTRFRGPDGSGLSKADTIPATWTEKDQNWKVKLPGAGISQPVTWGNKVFVKSAEEEGARRVVLCLSARDGATLWSRGFDSSTHRKHKRNTFASSTPTVDGERLYVSLGSPTSHLLLALDHEGKEVWGRDLGPFESQHGEGSSPILFDELVVLANELDGDSFVIALDRKTGQTRWKTPRRKAAMAYGTPCVFHEVNGRGASLAFSSEAHGLYSLNGQTGAVNWEAMVFDKRAVSSPVVAGTLMIGTCGSGGGGNYLVAVRTGGEGDVTSSHVAYKQTRTMPYVPTPLAKGDLLFLWGDMGIVTCLEIPTGTVLWQNRVGGNYSGSPVCAGDLIYCMSEEGEVVVIAAAREFKVVARNALGEGTRSTPAVAGGRMYLRTYSHLISVGGKLETAP